MKIKILENEIELKYSIRMNIIYENIAGETLDFTNISSIKQISTLMLACIYSSAQIQGITLNLTYDAYMNWLDANGGYQILNEFAIWLADEMMAQYNLLPKTEEDTEKKKPLKELKTKKKV